MNHEFRETYKALYDKETYLPIAIKAWEAMVDAVHDEGMLGYVQPIGDAPQNITAEKNEVYGTASFALAGLEVARYAREKKEKDCILHK